jgi:hypothetical protein
MSGLVLAGWREMVRKPAGNRRSHRRGWLVIGAQKLLRKSRDYFVCLQSASRRRAEAALWRAAKVEGLAQSKTLRVFQESSCRAPRLGVRRPSAALPSGISNGAKVNWNCYIPKNILVKSKDVYELHNKPVSHWCGER